MVVWCMVWWCWCVVVVVCGVYMVYGVWGGMWWCMVVQCEGMVLCGDIGYVYIVVVMVVMVCAGRMEMVCRCCMGNGGVLVWLM